MDKYFLSTDNIKTVSNQVFQALNINNNISIESKQNIVRKIYTIMQTIFQNMDKSKINQRNLNKAVEIFNTKAISSSVSQLNNIQSNRDIPPRPNYNPKQDQPYFNNNPSISQNTTPISFQRESEIYGNRNVIVNNRQTETYRQPNSNRQEMINSGYQNRQFTDILPQTTFSDSLQREQYLNGLNNKADKSIDDRLKNLQSQRNFEIPNINKKPQDIDFGLDWEGKNKRQPQTTNQQNSQNKRNLDPRLNESISSFDYSNQINSQNLEMNQQKSITGFNDGLSGFGMNPNMGDINSLDNYNTSILPSEIPTDDNLSFEQRLKKIETERSSLDTIQTSQTSQTSSNKKVSFSDDIQQNQRQFQQSNQRPLQQINQQSQRLQQNRNDPNQDIFFLNNNTNQDNLKQNINSDDNMNINNDLILKLNEYYNKLEELANILVQRDDEIIELNKNIEQNNNIKKEIDQKEGIIKQLQETITNTITNTRERYQKDLEEKNKELELILNENIKLKEILNEKDVIIKEIENKNNEEIIEKEKLLTNQLNELIEIQNEIEEKAKGHKMKETFLINKENELKELIISNNININSSQNIIIPYTKIILNNNSYEYKLQSFKNINQIQLLSYQANKIFNINDTNNILDLNVFLDNNVELVSDSDNDEKLYRDIKISLINGVYDNESIITTLNDILKPYNILFKLINNIVIVEGSHKFKMIKKESSLLYSLGFNNEVYSDTHKYVAENEILLNHSKYYSFKLNGISLGDIILGMNKENNIINNHIFDINFNTDKFKFTIEDENKNNVILRKPFQFSLMIKENTSNIDIKNFLQYNNAIIQ
jgi:hypothetical protein